MPGYYKTVEVAAVSVGGLTSAWLFGFCVTDEMVALISGASGLLKEVYRGFIVNTVMMFCCKSRCFLKLAYMFISM